MKITIKEKEKKVKNVNYDDINPGMVYQIDIGATLLKLDTGEAVILTNSSGRGWFELAHSGEGNFKNRPATKILGKLTEIVVDPNV